MRLVPPGRALPALLTPATVLLVCAPVGWDAGGSRLHLADLGSAVLVAVALWALLAGRRLPRTPLRWPLAASVITLGLATFAAADAGAAGAGLMRYTQVFVLVPLGVAVLLRGGADLWLVFGAVLVAAGIQSAVGAWQYWSGTGASFAGEPVRAVGTYGASDVMAMAAVVGYGIVVAAGLALESRVAGTSGRGGPFVGGLVVGGTAVAALLVVPLLLSLSRGALIATIAAVAVMVVVASPRLAGALAVVAASATLVLAATLGSGPAAPATSVSARLATIGSAGTTPDRSVRDRYDLWHASLRMWRARPVTGVGLKQFPDLRDRYAPLSLSASSDVADPAGGFRREPLLSPHNMYLLVLSEQGALGAASFAALVGGLAIATLRRARAGGTGPGGGIGPPGAPGAVVAAGIVTWTMVWFGYGDIGGPTTVLISVLLGVALWWAAQPRRPLPADHDPRFMIGGVRALQVHDRADLDRRGETV